MSKRITKEEILRNEPFEIEVPTLGKILIRQPTFGDLYEITKTTKGIEDEMERAHESNMLFLSKVLVEPSLTIDELQKLDHNTFALIFSAVQKELGKRIEESSRVISSFLEVPSERRETSGSSTSS